jgi:hypothetical protein
VVATPIGNLKDVTFRALATLAAADAVPGREVGSGLWVIAATLAQFRAG